VCVRARARVRVYIYIYFCSLNIFSVDVNLFCKLYEDIYKLILLTSNKLFTQI